jgi:hypothetical protein
MSDRFYPGQADYIGELNKLDDDVQDLKTGGSSAAPQRLHVQDRRPSGTAGQTFIGQGLPQDLLRELQTEVSNTIAGASLENNLITLPRGKYRLHAAAASHLTSGTGNIIFFNSFRITGKSAVNGPVPGDLGYSLSGRGTAGTITTTTTNTEVNCDFEITADSATIALEQRVQGNSGSNITVAMASGGYMEIYAEVIIDKIG